MHEVNTHPLEKEWCLAFSRYRNLEELSTSLSQKVYQLLLSEQISHVHENFLDENGLIHWNSLTKSKITNNDSTQDEDVLFQLASKFIQRASHSIHAQIFKNQSCNNLKRYLNDPDLYFILTNANIDIFKMFLNSYETCSPLVCFQVIVPFLERGLQDLIFNYLIMTDPELNLIKVKEKIPNKLNDLFVIPELNKVLGQDVVFLLRAFIGPLNGFNLRNITIHGFITPNEFRPCYTTFLLVLFMSVSKLTSKYFSGYHYKYREWFKCEYSEPNILMNSEAVSMVKQDFIDLFSSSMFVLPQWRVVWSEAIDLYEQQKYFHFLVAIFPLLEHSLRRVYVCSNGTQSALLTADKNTLYTTLDILLDTRGSNKIFEEIGAPLCNYLFDLFIWTDSEIRIRDHVSHGNVDPLCISHDIAHHVLLVALALCDKYNVSKKPCYIAEKCTRYILDEYKPLYHPKSVLINNIFRVEVQLNHFDGFVSQVDENNITINDSVQALSVEIHKRLDLLKDIRNQHGTRMIFDVHLPEKELKKYTVCNKIIIHVMNCCMMLEKKYLELNHKIKDRSAWKRDRKAFEFLTSVLNSFVSFFKLLLSLVEFCAATSEKESLALSVWNGSGAIESSISDNNFTRSFEIMLAMIVPQPNHITYRALTKRQALQMFI
ncbi:ER membrane-associated RNA degradation protein [Acrasis kona]|uniref:ER membrane-associated RNA degradation protein n=1 Tax=Acrasis kona TaxID=1008807 RepID=A0AAW2YHP8_9EUKA